MTSSQRLLLVEDNNDIRNAFAYILMSFGYDVAECADGASAIAEATKRPPEVAIIDVGLPDIDGYKVASAIRRIEKRIGCQTHSVLVALAGDEQLPTPQQSKQAKFDLYFAKPVEPQTVCAEIQELQASRLENSTHD